MQISTGGVGFGGLGKVVGINSYKPTKAAPWTFGACAALAVGGCAHGTKDDTGNIRYGGGLTIGEGGYIGLMATPLSLNFSDQESYFLWWHWRM